MPWIEPPSLAPAGEVVGFTLAAETTLAAEIALATETALAAKTPLADETALAGDSPPCRLRCLANKRSHLRPGTRMACARAICSAVQNSGLFGCTEQRIGRRPPSAQQSSQKQNSVSP